VALQCGGVHKVKAQLELVTALHNRSAKKEKEALATRLSDRMFR
jgi:hypothetical protein